MRQNTFSWRTLVVAALSLAAIVIDALSGGWAAPPRPLATRSVPRMAAAVTPPRSLACAPPPACHPPHALAAREAVRPKTPNSQHSPRYILQPTPPTLPSPAIETIAGRTFRLIRVVEMTASTYGVGEPGVGPHTATGTLARVGEVAVDPRVIPLGSTLYVSGYHTSYLPIGGLLAHAEDTGGAIKGARIDLYMAAPLAALAEFGLQPVKVAVLSPLH